MWILVIIFVVVFISYIFVSFRPSGMPPGPRFRLPLIGSMYKLGSDPLKGVSKLRKMYGDIFSLNLGNDYLVYVCDFETMEKIGKMDVFTTRQNIYEKETAAKIIHWCRHEDPDPGVNHGIVNNDGQSWSEQRRFALRHLKDFGFGRSAMEDLIIDEAKELISDIKTEIGTNDKVVINERFNLAIINSLWQIITSKRLDPQNQEDKQRIHDLNDFFRQFGITGLVMVVALRLPMFLATKIPALIKIRGLYGRLFQWFRQESEEHEATFDGDNLRDFLDTYIAERKRANDANDVNSTFYGNKGDMNYVFTMFDLFLAGSETTSTTLTYAVLLMLHDPQPWKKAQQELDKVVGRSRLPTLADRPDLPYFEALISELMRRSNVAPFAVFHSNHVATHLNQFKIPPHAVIVFALTEVLNNPKYFPEPEKFKPERFLKEVDSKLVYEPHPALVYFGIGKRECLGKSLAKTELFLFLSALVHTFDFEPTDEGFPGLDDCTVSITRSPKLFNAKISVRQN